MNDAVDNADQKLFRYIANNYPRIAISYSEEWVFVVLDSCLELKTLWIREWQIAKNDVRTSDDWERILSRSMLGELSMEAGFRWMHSYPLSAVDELFNVWRTERCKVCHRSFPLSPDTSDTVCAWTASSPPWQQLQDCGDHERDFRFVVSSRLGLHCRCVCESRSVRRQQTVCDSIQPSWWRSILLPPRSWKAWVFSIHLSIFTWGTHTKPMWWVQLLLGGILFWLPTTPSQQRYPIVPRRSLFRR